MADKSKRKVEIWVVTAPFVFGKETYEPGDEWAVPAGYTLDEEQTRLNKGNPTFKRVQEFGPSDKKWEQITYEILPVTRPEEGASA